MHYETLDPKNQRVSHQSSSHPPPHSLTHSHPHLLQVGDFKEAFNFGEPSPQGLLQQPIPPTISSSSAFITDFHTSCYRLSLRLNTLLGIGLSVTPPSFFTSAHLRENGASGTILRLLYYPAQSSITSEEGEEKSDGDVRAGAHSDYGSLTLLFRLKGQAGLEIQTREGEWVPVPVCPPGTEDDAQPPILVNIGDLLSYWTNGLLRSTVHRVVFPGAGAGASEGSNGMVEGESGEGERYSIAFFCHPVGTSKLEPVPSERVRKFGEENGQVKKNGERKMLTADEHLMSRYVFLLFFSQILAMYC